MPPPQARSNAEVAAAFRELADLIEIVGGDRFRILAYRRAAETISNLGLDVADLENRELTSFRGIGRATAGKVEEFLTTGTMAKLDEMRGLVPAGLRELTALAGLGPKKAMLLHAELGIANLDDLRAAIGSQQVREVRGLGPKTEENLRRALDRYSPEEQRMLLGQALSIAEEMVATLSEADKVKRVAYAGSLRRMKETIGDIDLLASSSDAEAVMDAFSALPGVIRVAARGRTKSTAVTRHGVQVDIRVVAPAQFGAALQYFTGSKEHNVKVREHAVKLGYKLSEYGLFRVKGDELVAAETEEEVYAALDMLTPPPTMREDRGEVELALARELPLPVEQGDLRGDLQGHSTYSDGRLSIGKMAEAALARGYEYWAVTDHGRRLSVVKHLELEDIARQAREIQKVNRALRGRIKVLHGVELNIGADGGLDYPDEVLAGFDIVVASIHSAPWDKEGMTKRLLRAIDNPHVDVIGHPSGRRMGGVRRREGGEFDLAAVFKAAAKRRVAMEVNANEHRLDLRDEHVRVANDLGCLFAISTDAHMISDLDYMRLGVFTAQRGWVTKERVLNTWGLSKLEGFVRERRSE